MHLSVLKSTLLVIISLEAAAQAPLGTDRDCSKHIRLERVAVSRAQIPQSGNRGAAADSVDSDLITVETDLVSVDFDVRDKRGFPITNLKATDLRLEEDGIEQAIEVFSFGRETAFRRRIILVIDHSQSQIPYLTTSIDAAKVLIDLLEPNDELAIVTDDVELVSDFTSDHEILKTQLERLRSKAFAGNFGRSKQLTALYTSLKDLFDENDRRPVVILQSDGDETADFSFRRALGNENKCPRIPGSFAEIEAELVRTRATVYSIIPGLKAGQGSDKQALENAAFELRAIQKSNSQLKAGSNSQPNQEFSKKFLSNWVAGRVRNANSVERISSISGGSTYYLSNPDEAANVYMRILEEMNQRYLIGYYPTNTRKDGKPRKIRLILRHDLGYSISGKNSYIPPRRP